MRIKKKGSDRIAIIYVDKELMESQELMLCVNLSEKNDAIGLFVENDKSGEKKEWYIIIFIIISIIVISIIF